MLAASIALVCIIGPNPSLYARISPDVQDYQSVLSRVRQAFDSETLGDVRREFADKSDQSVYHSFGLAVLDFYYRKLSLYGARLPRLEVESQKEIQERLSKCMSRDKRSAYPIAGYAWTVTLFREPGMAQPITEVVGSSDVKGSDGKVIKVPIKRVIGDPAMEKRIAELVQKARGIEYGNPLASYLSAVPVRDPATKVTIIQKYLGTIGQYLWEVDAIAHIKRSAPTDSPLHSEMDLRLETLRTKIGSGSPRLKAHGF